MTCRNFLMCPLIYKEHFHEIISDLETQISAYVDPFFIIDEGFYLADSSLSFRKQLFSKWQKRSVVISAGESCKTQKSLEVILDTLLKADPKPSLIVAVGGGALTDVAGLASHLLHRGVPWITVPTTSLGMVDAGLGGKCAINWNGVKNQIGALHYPLAVYSCFEFLGYSLENETVRGGLIEAYKSSLLASDTLRKKILRFSKGQENLASWIQPAAQIKDRVVFFDLDKRYKGLRHLLALGHTVAHGLEMALSQEGLSHAMAVAMGLVVEGCVQQGENQSLQTFFKQMCQDLKELGCRWPNVDESRWQIAIEAMGYDKRRKSEKIPLTKFGNFFEMISLESSPKEGQNYIVEVSLKEIDDAWRACQLIMA